MDKVSFTIDGLEVVVDNGTSVLEAALRNNIYIPHLCYHPDLEARGACRLCIVEIGGGELVTSCRMPVESGMVVKTKSPKIEKIIRPVVELLIADHHASCASCPSSSHCELQKLMAHLRIDRRRVRRLRLPKVKAPLDTTNPCFDYDPNKCVLCGICLQTCESIHRVSALYYVGRGYTTRIAFYGDKSRCESCRECVTRCPVGALISRKT
ncbi:MAG: 2Fe-2S ferredoxin [Chloroflexi bacterium CG_4_9_14_3_um_filter_45_9]|nr:MAG: 2Fe-2S ferredoxin [Chloroflexi bacterium CG08_land_8_20_14_0_20_45_12]PIX26974.1 MAG: 2Fe-2S ferredoxin [Chloroflexi bacterium CG_4_8_14_3_um_filter_45_15]PJB49410.1 MAG: 2Fe-2S ferredoxin [Chloroflexi bacterium CG_4_9_14_3_um_filter_45_9]